jgi:hypothetical protein
MKLETAACLVALEPLRPHFMELYNASHAAALPGLQVGVKPTTSNLQTPACVSVNMLYLKRCLCNSAIPALHYGFVCRVL